MIPPLLITTSAPDLEKSIEKGGTLSGRLNTDDGVNHLVDSLSKGLPFEDAHTFAKGCGDLIPAATDTDVKKKKTKKSVDDALDDIMKAKYLQKIGEGENARYIYKRVHIREKGHSTHVDSNSHGLNAESVIGFLNNKMNPLGFTIHKTTPEEKKEFGSNAVRILSGKGHTFIAKVNLQGGTWQVVDNNAYLNGELKYDKPTPYTSVHLDHEDNAKHLTGDIQKSFKREVPPKPGAKVHKPIKDAEQKRQEAAERNSVSKALAFIIDPSRDVKDPLLANTHGEDWHSDADKETVDFLTRTGSVNPDDPVHNPPVTPELNGFPLAIPMFYCSLPESDLIKSDDDILMRKAFNW